MDVSTRVSVNRLAELVDMDRRTVRRRLAGIPKGPDGRYDSREALPAIFAAEGPTDLDHQLARLYHARANLAELKAARLRAELVPADVVVGYWEDILAKTTTRLRRLPGEAARAVHGLRDLHLVEDRLTTAVHRALHDLADVTPGAR